MTNAELIKALRTCARQTYCDNCPCYTDPDESAIACAERTLEDAADALEAAEQRIAELMPKEGEWIWENYCWHCSVCGENPTRGMGYVQGKNELFKVCPNCGARMRGEHDGNAV